jgi:molybdate transport system substrate-binding protein
VAAASDLQAVLPEIIAKFRAADPIDVTPVYGASGQLARQIEQGAPYDVFLAANRAYVNVLAAQGVIEPDSVRSYAHGVLVLVVNRESGVPIQDLADLVRPEAKKVAIANPAVAPYGQAARQALERAKLAEPVGPKLVQAESVRQALQYVATGNAEAGLVAHSVSKVPEVRVIDIDPGLYDPVIQGLGVVARSGQVQAARRFAAFLMGKEGQATLASFGFRPPARAPAESQ